MKKKWQIYYDRKAIYGDGTEDVRYGNLDTTYIDVDIYGLIENIYTNQKFLDCRESDVIEMTKYEILEETSLYIENIYLWDGDKIIEEYDDDEINKIYEDLIKKGVIDTLN